MTRILLNFEINPFIDISNVEALGREISVFLDRKYLSISRNIVCIRVACNVRPFRRACARFAAYRGLLDPFRPVPTRCQRRALEGPYFLLINVR